MTFKILLFILLLIVAEVVHLLNEGIVEHKLAFGILKIMILNIIFLVILSVKSFYLNVLIKIKKVMPEIIKSAAKVIMTPIKSSKDEDLNN